MSQRTENQVNEMKKQTIGVEVEMNNITREKAARLAECSCTSCMRTD